MNVPIEYFKFFQLFWSIFYIHSYTSGAKKEFPRASWSGKYKSISSMLFPCRFLGIPLLCLAWFFAYLSILNFPFSFLPMLYWYVLVRCTHVFSGKKYDEGLSLGKSKVDVLNRGPKLTFNAVLQTPNLTELYHSGFFSI